MVISWNNYDDVVSCVASLLNQTFPTVDVVIVDNNSKHQTRKLLRDYCRSLTNKRVSYVQSQDNNGTAGGFNHGIRWAIAHNYSYIGSLNADAVADTAWVSSLVKVLDENPKIGVATGLMARANKETIDTAGEVFSTWGTPGPSYRDRPIGMAPKRRYVFGFTGGGFLSRCALYQSIGYFDERFFMYFEDSDLSFRAQLAGWKVYYTPKAIAYHQIGASSRTVPGLTVYNTFKNLPLLFFKNAPLRLWAGMLPRFTLMYTLIFANAIRNGSGVFALKGFLKSIAYSVSTFRLRLSTQKQRRVPVSYIDSIILHDIPPEQTGLRKFRAIFTGRK